jgi:hypothetical protein
MKANYKVVDNFLNQDSFKKLQSIILGDQLPWYYNTSVSTSTSKDGICFTHYFYVENLGRSQRFDIVEDVINILDPYLILKIKANLYPQTEKIIEHGRHADFGFGVKNKGFILYINDNDGFTRLADGTKIKSVANRGLYFDGSTEHNSTTCTDANARFNINFNYIEKLENKEGENKNEDNNTISNNSRLISDKLYI